MVKVYVNRGPSLKNIGGREKEIMQGRARNSNGDKSQNGIIYLFNDKSIRQAILNIHGLTLNTGHLRG